MSKPSLFTVVSPSLLHLYPVQDAVVVVIDVFRATSTIAAALYNGAEKVIPVDSVAGAIEIGQEIGAITGGERDGKIAEGLQHGNSPLEYPSSFIGGKTLVLTTTNGTRLLHMALKMGATTVITGAFANLSSVAEFIKEANKPVLLCCAAWKDRVNSEDTLFAGGVISRVKEHFQIHCDASLIAETMYRHASEDMWAYTKQTTHFHRLSSYGLEPDMRWCITEDIAPVLPVYRDGALFKG